MKIAGIELKGDALLAPIAGFTDVGFRDIAARYGASLTYTEMISCKGMVYGSEKTKELLATTDNPSNFFYSCRKTTFLSNCWSSVFLSIKLNK